MFRFFGGKNQKVTQLIHERFFLKKQMDIPGNGWVQEYT